MFAAFAGMAAHHRSAWALSIVSPIALVETLSETSFTIRRRF